jgi:hypothetical protein
VFRLQARFDSLLWNQPFAVLLAARYLAGPQELVQMAEPHAKFSCCISGRDFLRLGHQVDLPGSDSSLYSHIDVGIAIRAICATQTHHEPITPALHVLITPRGVYSLPRYTDAIVIRQDDFHAEHP